MRKFLIILLVAILVFHFFALKYNWYHTVWWLDIPMHMIGGIWLGVLFYYLFAEKLSWISKAHPLFFLLAGLGFVILIGVFWEWLDFFLDVIVFKSYPYNAEPGYILFDTHTDFFNDLLGGAIALLGLIKFKK